MKNREMVLWYLNEEKAPFCDDCLSYHLGIKPRQQINQICNKLKEKELIQRKKDFCSECKQKKIVNSVNKDSLKPREESGSALSEIQLSERFRGQELEVLIQKFFESQLNQQFSEKELIVGPNKAHKFDLVSTDESIVIECKSYTWTKGGNFPSAKITHLLEAIFYFSRITNCRKILVIQDDFDVRQGSLVEMFVRRYDGLIDDVEVWSFYNGEITMVRPAKESCYKIVLSQG